MNKKIIIVDDDAVVLFLHKILVQKTLPSITPYCYQRAQEAYNFLCNRENQDPVLILLDINMPEMSGWDFLEKITETGRSEKVTVAMVTSSINSSDRKKAQQYSQVVDFIEKPLSPEDCTRILSQF